MTRKSDFNNILDMFHQLSFFEKKLSRKKVPPKVDEVLFRDHLVEIQRRPYQRSMNLLLRPNGALKVTAGRGVSHRVIREFLEKNAEWILKNMIHAEEMRKKYPPKKFVDGEKFLILGELKELRLIEGHARKPRVSVQGSELVVIHARGARADRLKEAIRDFYHEKGQCVLRSKVEVFSEAMELYPRQLRFRSMKSQWGSCSTNGIVTLNTRLVVFPEEYQDYVVVHELSHLVHPNHSQKFWRLVEKFCPSYKNCRRHLAENQFETDFLAKKSGLYLDH